LKSKTMEISTFSSEDGDCTRRTKQKL